MDIKDSDLWYYKAVIFYLKKKSAFYFYLKIKSALFWDSWRRNQVRLTLAQKLMGKKSQYDCNLVEKFWITTQKSHANYVKNSLTCLLEQYNSVQCVEVETAHILSLTL